jgi:hypothetical protein
MCITGNGKTRTAGTIASWCWNAAVSPVTFVVLSILWCVDLAVGSILAYYRDPGFWVKMDASPFNKWLKDVAPETFPASLWIYILVALSWLMVGILLLCTLNWFVRRKLRLRGWAEFMIHLGFLLIFAGFVVGNTFGSRSLVRLEEGAEVPVPGTGVSLMLKELEIVEGPGGRTVDTRSDMILIPVEGDPQRGTVRTNHPMIRKSMVIYPPERFGSMVTGGVVGTSTSGILRLSPGGKFALTDGRSLVLGGTLQAGQTRGAAVGPGILVVMEGQGGDAIGSLFLSRSAGMKQEGVIEDVRITLGELTWATIGLYRVHEDPGVRMVIAGAIILAFGTIWALAVYFGVVRGIEGQGFAV